MLSVTPNADNLLSASAVGLVLVALRESLTRESGSGFVVSTLLGADVSALGETYRFIRGMLKD